MIHFFKQDIKFRIGNVTLLRRWITSAIKKEKRNAGEINFIFCTDKFLLSLNKKYLRHSTLTDIITFDYSDNKTLSGDIYISIERVKENAALFNSPLTTELHRVMIHGVMHLCGYTDKTKSQKQEIRSKEDYYLSLRKF